MPLIPFFHILQVRPQAEAYLSELMKYELRQPYDGNVIQKAYITFLNAILSETKRGGGRIFYLPMMGQRDPEIGTEYAWIPWGLVSQGGHAISGVLLVTLCKGG